MRTYIFASQLQLEKWKLCGMPKDMEKNARENTPKRHTRNITWGRYITINVWKTRPLSRSKKVLRLSELKSIFFFRFCLCYGSFLSWLIREQCFLVHSGLCFDQWQVRAIKWILPERRMPFAVVSGLPGKMLLSGIRYGFDPWTDISYFTNLK